MKTVRHSYEHLRAAYGDAWADRLWAHQEHGMGEPPGDTYVRGCPACAGYGRPGWVVEDRRQWSRCPGCNPPGRDQAGREVWKGAVG